MSNPGNSRRPPGPNRHPLGRPRTIEEIDADQAQLDEERRLALLNAQRLDRERIQSSIAAHEGYGAYQQPLAPSYNQGGILMIPPFIGGYQVNPPSYGGGYQQLPPLYGGGYQQNPNPQWGGYQNPNRGRGGYSNNPSGQQRPYYQRPKGPRVDKKCGNYQQPGHEGKDCVGPIDEYGFVNVCPRCNTADHNLWTCPVESYPRDLRHWLQNRREGKPPLAWGEDYSRWEYPAHSTNRPWSREYSLAHANAWRGHRYRVPGEQDTENRPYDPAWDRNMRDQSHPALRNTRPRRNQLLGYRSERARSASPHRDETRGNTERSRGRPESRRPNENRDRVEPSRGNQYRERNSPLANAGLVKVEDFSDSEGKVDIKTEEIEGAEGPATTSHAMENQAPNQLDNVSSGAHPQDDGEDNRYKDEAFDESPKQMLAHLQSAQGEPTNIGNHQITGRVCRNCGEDGRERRHCPHIGCGDCGKDGSGRHQAPDCRAKHRCGCKEYPWHVQYDCHVPCQTCRGRPGGDHTALACTKRCCKCGKRNKHPGHKCPTVGLQCPVDGKRHFGQEHWTDQSVICQNPGCGRYGHECPEHCSNCALPHHDVGVPCPYEATRNDADGEAMLRCGRTNHKAFRKGTKCVQCKAEEGNRKNNRGGRGGGGSGGGRGGGSGGYGGMKYRY